MRFHVIKNFWIYQKKSSEVRTSIADFIEHMHDTKRSFVAQYGKGDAVDSSPGGENGMFFQANRLNPSPSVRSLS
jgi:hypothetical protein